ncbi:MAG: hypothetical protein QW703_01425 [Candidatus Aenigmatarchaeota archaeon]
MWKLIFAIFIALLILAAIVGIKSDIIQIPELRTFFAKSNLVSEKHIELEISPKNFSFKKEKPINLSLANVSLEGFVGDVKVDFETGEILFKPKAMQLQITTPIQEIDFEDINIASFSYQDIPFTLKPNVTGIGDIEVKSFYGNVSIKTDRISITGNVSDFVFRLNNMSFQLS